MREDRGIENRLVELEHLPEQGEHRGSCEHDPAQTHQPRGETVEQKGQPQQGPDRGRLREVSDHGGPEQAPVVHRRRAADSIAETGQKHQPGRADKSHRRPRGQPAPARDGGREHRLGAVARLLGPQSAGGDDRIGADDHREVQSHVSEVAVDEAGPAAHDLQDLLGHIGCALVHGSGE